MAEMQEMPEQPQQQEAQGGGQAEQLLAGISGAMGKSVEILQSMGASDAALQKVEQAKDLYQQAVQEALGGGQEEQRPEASAPAPMEAGARGVPLGR